MKEEYEISIRPKNLNEFVGQNNVKDNLAVFIKAALIREEVLDHVLLHGFPGLGKTTLAHIIAREMGSDIKTISGPSLEKPGDLASVLSSLSEGDILFIDEIHRMPTFLEEMLYPAMEDYYFDVIINNDGRSKSIRIDLPPFTLIGATTRSGDLSSPLRSRFGIECKLELYTEEEISSIIKRTSKVINTSIESEAALEIAKRSRKTPRIANKILKRVSDFSIVEKSECITVEDCFKSLEKLGIDKSGLNNLDIVYLNNLINKFGGGPVGVETIASSMGESVRTIEESIEGYLMQEGFIKKTLRGRVAMPKSYEHLKIPMNMGLFDK